MLMARMPRREAVLEGRRIVAKPTPLTLAGLTLEALPERPEAVVSVEVVDEGEEERGRKERYA